MSETRTSVNDLAKACAHSADAAEWQQFLRLCMPLVSVVALRLSRMWLSATSPATVDDIVQEVFLKLCEHERRILRDFEPRGEDSFFGLLRTVTGSVANDYFRRLNSNKRGGKVITMALQEESGPRPNEGPRQVVTHPEGAAPAERMHQSALFAQLDEKLRAAPAEIAERDRVLFWLYYRQGYTAEEIARLHATGMTAKGVESALRRVTVWLRKQVARGQPEPDVNSE